MNGTGFCLQGAASAPKPRAGHPRLILFALLALVWAWSGCGDDSNGSDAPSGPVCGDGVIEGAEICDDGNTAGGDGCSAACAVERGWSCDGEPSVCGPAIPAGVCGDGRLQGDEGCDDGNTAGGDGCSPACTVEDGWTCDGAPSVCEEVPAGESCGDGVIDDGEGCDDGGRDPGDGCSANCRVEAGWSCEGEPSVCVEDDTSSDTTCGDGVVEEGEGCDDGNTDDGDGCSADCAIEEGWDCEGEPSACWVPCAQAVDCEGLRDGCTNALCDVNAGRCRTVTLPDGVACEAEGVCVEGGECSGGTCVGTPLDCSSLDDGCTVGVCSESTGACEAITREEGEPCGPEGACGREICREGACLLEPVDDCTACGDDAICVDGECLSTAGAPAAIDFVSGSLPAPLRTAGDVPWTVVADSTSSVGQVARSGAIGPNGTTSLLWDVDLAEPAELEFRFRMESESCCDSLIFFVDGVVVEDWAGVIGWRTETFTIAPGEHTLEWRYTKDWSVNTGADAVFIESIALDGGGAGSGECATECGDAVWTGERCLVCDPAPNGTACTVDDNPCRAASCEDGECVAFDVEDGTACGEATECGALVCSAGACVVDAVSDCTPCADGTDFCAGGLCGGVSPERVIDFADGSFPDDFAFSGAAPWRIDTTRSSSGAFSARSGAIGNNGTSSMTLEVTLPSDGSVSFQYRTSTESCCDKLRFFVGSRELLNVGGGGEWRSFTTDLDAGTYTLRWSYTKDGSVSSGDDSVWVDAIRVAGGREPCDTTCGTRLDNGETCVLCDPSPAGTDCSDEDDPCRAGACDDGECVFTDVADGTSCGPADGCTGLFCQAGACVTGPANDGFVCGPGTACTEEVCVGGSCESSPLEDGTTCGDDLECASQQCVAGACEPIPFDEGATCGDDLECASQRCVEGACTPIPFEDGTTCGDDLECAAQQCFEGVCGLAPFDDCQPCADGASYCAGGYCGGAPSELAWDFADGVFPDDFTSGGFAPFTVDASTSAVGGFSLRSGAIGNRASSILRLEVELLDAGEISFQYRTSSEACCDKLRFFIDGVEVLDRGGDVAWTSFSAPLAAGEHTLEWTYTKDISAVQLLDAVWVDDIRVTGVQAACFDVCGEAIFDGESCRVCEPAEDGTDCTEPEDPCRVGSCEEGACAFTNVADGVACGPTEGCGAFVCQAGTCALAPVDDGTACDAGDDPCRAGSCDEGVCVSLPVDDGTVCGEVGDCWAFTCQAGACDRVNAGDCTACGDGSFCGGGVCGGIAPERLWDFDDETVPAEFTFAGNAPWRTDDTQSVSEPFSFRAGAIGNSQSSTFELAVELVEEGTVSFDWRASSEACCDTLAFTVNGTERFRSGGGDTWTTANYTLPAGSHTLRWTYAKDASATSGADTAWIDNLRVTGLARTCGDDCGPAFDVGGTCLSCAPVADGTDCTDPDDPCMVGSCEEGVCAQIPVADCTPCEGAEGASVCAGGLCGGVRPVQDLGPRTSFVDSGFTTGGSLPWNLRATGGPAGPEFAESGAIGNFGTSWLETEVSLSGPGTVSFWVEVGSEPNFDLGEFYVGGILIQSWSGSVPWFRFTQALPAGDHTLRWQYSKDGGLNISPDRMRIAGVEVELDEACPAGAACELPFFTGDGCAYCPDPVCE